MTAHDLVMDAIATVQRDPKELELERRLQLDRLDALQPVFYRRAVSGDPASIQIMLRLTYMPTRYLGLG